MAFKVEKDWIRFEWQEGFCRGVRGGSRVVLAPRWKRASHVVCKADWWDPGWLDSGMMKGKGVRTTWVIA